MKNIRLYKLENWMDIAEKPEYAVIYSGPCKALLKLQKQGYCVLAELAHLQGLSEQKQAEALSAEVCTEQYQNVCICAEELPQAYLRRIWCRAVGQPVMIAETERLLIRESIPEDAEAFGKLYQDEACRRFLELIPAKQARCREQKQYSSQEFSDIQNSEKASEQLWQHKVYSQYIKEYIRSQYAFYEYGMWTVLEKKSGAVIGRMGLEQLTDSEDRLAADGQQALSLGYALLPEYRGFGYASEGCSAILSYCRECEYTDHITIKIDRENAPSIKLAKRLQADNQTGITVHISIT